MVKARCLHTRALPKKKMAVGRWLREATAHLVASCCQFGLQVLADDLWQKQPLAQLLEKTATSDGFGNLSTDHDRPYVAFVHSILFLLFRGTTGEAAEHFNKDSLVLVAEEWLENGKDLAGAHLLISKR